jgi:hypothetical protein
MEKPEQQHEGVDIELLKRKRDEIFDDLEKYDKLAEFIGRLKAKYEDYQEYLLYHMFTGSTPPQELAKIDFPGDDSIEKFIDSLLSK